jgi:hypothetical protein
MQYLKDAVMVMHDVVGGGCKLQTVTCSIVLWRSHDRSQTLRLGGKIMTRFGIDYLY